MCTERKATGEYVLACCQFATMQHRINKGTCSWFCWRRKGLCIKSLCSLSIALCTKLQTILCLCTTTVHRNEDKIMHFFQRELSIINFTLNYPPIRNNLTSASLLSMLIETDYLNYPPIRNNLSSASLPLSCAGAILKILNSI